MYVTRKTETGEDTSPERPPGQQDAAAKDRPFQPAFERLHVRQMPPQMRGIAFGGLPSEEDEMRKELESLAAGCNSLAGNLGLKPVASGPEMLRSLVPMLRVAVETIEARHREDDPSGRQDLERLEAMERTLRSDFTDVLAKRTKMNADYQKRKQKAIASRNETADVHAANDGIHEALVTLRLRIDLLSAEVEFLENKKARQAGQLPDLAGEFRGLESRRKEVERDLEESRTRLEEARGRLSEQETTRRQAVADLKARRKDIKTGRKAATHQEVDAAWKSYEASLAEIDAKLGELDDVFREASTLEKRIVKNAQVLLATSAVGKADREVALKALDDEKADLEAKEAAADAQLRKTARRKEALLKEIADLERPDRVGKTEYLADLSELGVLLKQVELLEEEKRRSRRGD
jgi:chromosome segregation ATPase